MFQTLFLLISLFTFQSNTASLELRIENAKNDQGLVRVLVFNEAAGFPDKPDKAIRMANLSIKNKVAMITFDDLAPGNYAIAVFHDSTKSGKIRTNLVGFPLDRYGFSNNATGIMGPPSFEKAAFPITTGKNSITISMR